MTFSFSARHFVSCKNGWMDKNVKASREIIRLDTVNRPLNNICKIYINSNILPFNPENLLAVYTESNCVLTK